MYSGYAGTAGDRQEDRSSDRSDRRTDQTGGHFVYIYRWLSPISEGYHHHQSSCRAIVVYRVSDISDPSPEYCPCHTRRSAGQRPSRLYADALAKPRKTSRRILCVARESAEGDPQSQSSQLYDGPYCVWTQA